MVARGRRAAGAGGQRGEQLGEQLRRLRDAVKIWSRAAASSTPQRCVNLSGCHRPISERSARRRAAASGRCATSTPSTSSRPSARPARGAPPRHGHGMSPNFSGVAAARSPSTRQPSAYASRAAFPPRAARAARQPVLLPARRVLRPAARWRRGRSDSRRSSRASPRRARRRAQHWRPLRRDLPEPVVAVCHAAAVVVKAAVEGVVPLLVRRLLAQPRLPARALGAAARALGARADARRTSAALDRVAHRHAAAVAHAEVNLLAAQPRLAEQHLHRRGRGDVDGRPAVVVDGVYVGAGREKRA